MIGREELKAKLDWGDEFKLVMVLGNLAFWAKHISGWLNIHTLQRAKKQLHPNDEFIVYCSDPTCIASQAA